MKKRRLKKQYKILLYTIFYMYIYYCFIYTTIDIYKYINKPFNVFIYLIACIISIQFGFTYLLKLEDIKKQYRKEV